MTPPVYIVSGLPRSGTSMMMRMLAAGGLPVLTDEVREADSDNPRGYFELEAVKGSAKDASWVRQAPGKAVKVISYLLRSLPADLEYRVVFMRRSLDQVVRSQRVMLERLGQPVEQTDEEAREQLANHVVDVEAWLDTATHVRRLGVAYERVLADPRPQAERIAAFLGPDLGDLQLDVDAMVRAVEPALQRQR
ncbi:MAG TPA: sulfotransferase [Kofleriaceae bacterium]|nr:sulfotransferase [Kofleriaceae bacterium]